MKILFVSNFRSETTRAILCNARRFLKGFLRNGHDVMPFDYPAALQRASLIRKKSWASRFARRKADRALEAVASEFNPDLVYFSAIGCLTAETVQHVRLAAPNAIYVCRFSDMRAHADPHMMTVAQHCDWLVATNCGQFLREAKEGGIANCAFLPNPSDPDIEGPRDVSPQWRSNVLFTGKLQHKLAGQDSTRRELVQSLAEKGKLTVWGCLGKPSVRSRDYLNAICGAKIGLSINAFNDVDRYHSDRFTHYLSNGAFVLAKYVPGSELLFEHDKHLCYFRTNEECLELIDRLLADNKRRLKIAAAGMERMHRDFNSTKLARHLVELATTGSYSETWAQIL